MQRDIEMMKVLKEHKNTPKKKNNEKNQGNGKNK